MLRFDGGFGRRDFSHTPTATRSVMPEFQPISSVHISAIKRPACPNCRDSRMLLSKLETGRSGFGTGSFECQKCGRVQTTVVSGDPMTSQMRGWLAGELKPPT
jgi:hypothetical protein